MGSRKPAEKRRKKRQETGLRVFSEKEVSIVTDGNMGSTVKKLRRGTVIILAAALAAWTAMAMGDELRNIFSSLRDWFFR